MDNLLETLKEKLGEGIELTKEDLGRLSETDLVELEAYQDELEENSGEDTSKDDVKPGEFLKQLKEGKIKIGDKIEFTPKGVEESNTCVVDKAFLALPVQSNEYYEEFKYKKC